MSLETRILALAQAIAADVKALQAASGGAAGGDTALVLAANRTIAAGSGVYAPDNYEIGAGVALEIGAEGVLEIG